MDFYHVSQHLWAVARTLHPDDAAAAHAWVEPLLAKLKAEASCEVIIELEQLQGRLQGAAQEQVQQEINYLHSHPQRTGQFWSQTGDEALMFLETFRRNDRWALLFPPATLADLSKN